MEFMKKTNKLISLLCLSAAAGGAIYAINKGISYLAERMDYLSTDNGHIYNWKFGNIYYTKQGTGSPILLIHDLQPYGCGAQWKEVEVEYAKAHTVYTIDLLGCGRSDKPEMTYTNFLYVQMLTDFIQDVLDGEAVDVITSGNAVSIAAMACLNNNALFKTLIFLSPVSITVAQAVPTKNRKLAKFLLELPLIGTLIYNICYNTENINKRIRNHYFAHPYMVSATLLKSFYQAAHTQHGNGKYLFSSLTGHYTTALLSKAISEISNSMIIIYGSEDETSQRIAEEYKKLNPIIEAQSIKGAKKMVQIEQADQLCNATEIYL
jgi:pimeloyl-ACP methyl ester carboxylesterase